MRGRLWVDPRDSLTIPDSDSIAPKPTCFKTMDDPGFTGNLQAENLSHLLLQLSDSATVRWDLFHKARTSVGQLTTMLTHDEAKEVLALPKRVFESVLTRYVTTFVRDVTVENSVMFFKVLTAKATSEFLCIGTPCSSMEISDLRALQSNCLQVWIDKVFRTGSAST